MCVCVTHKQRETVAGSSCTMQGWVVQCMCARERVPVCVCARANVQGELLVAASLEKKKKKKKTKSRARENAIKYVGGNFSFQVNLS